MTPSIELRAGRAPTAWPAALLQILGLVASSHILYLVAARLPGFDSSGLAGVTALFARTDPGEVTRALWISAIVPAIGEELLFRGAFFGLLQRIAGARSAIVGSALLFAVAHLDPHHAAVAFVLGLQLGALRLAHGLPLAIAAHLVNNGLVILTIALATGDGSISPGSERPEGGLLTFGAALALSGSACAALRHRLRSSPSTHPRLRTELQTARHPDD